METLADTLRQEEITARRAVVTAAAPMRRAAVDRTVAAGIPVAVAGITGRASLWCEVLARQAFGGNLRDRRPGETSKERKGSRVGGAGGE
jgi:hypothetical protein